MLFSIFERLQRPNKFLEVNEFIKCSKINLNVFPCYYRKIGKKHVYSFKKVPKMRMLVRVAEISLHVQIQRDITIDF